MQTRSWGADNLGMRTTTLALGCIASLICGVMLVSTERLAGAALALAGAALVLAWLRGLTSRRVGPKGPSEARVSKRAQAQPSTIRVRLDGVKLAAAVVMTIGLARGASVGPSLPPQVPDRGWGASLREFEVVGASEPGVRCEVELRDPRASRGATLRIAAPPESCPLAAGQRVAVLPRTFVERWRESSASEREHDLGRPPALWLRPTPAARGLRRIEVGYWHRVAALRQRAWASTRGDPSASLVVAIGLGLRSALAPEQREQLRAAGLGHLIAVSGLHVAVAAMWLSLVVRRAVVMLGGSPRWACAIAWLPLWAYVGLTGAAASAVRAALMLTGIDLATIAGRPQHGPTLLATTAAAMLLWQPQWLLDPGFALSIAAMAAIVTAPRELGLLATSWRITWATAPLSVLWFDAAPLHGLIGNAFALPIFSVLMPLALVASLVPGSIGALAMTLAKIAAAPILDLATLLAELPSVGPGGLLLVALLVLWCHRRRRRRRRGIEDRRTSTSPWLPPRLACVVAVLVAALLLIDERIDGRRSDPLELDWVALGSVHSRSLLVADPSASASACLYRPTGSSATWLSLLEQLEVRRLARIDAALPDPDRPDAPDAALDPGTRALVEQLERAGIELGGTDRCQPPEPARVRAALRACQFRQAGRGRALARSHAGEIHCRIGDRWVLAPELSESDP
ncbi:MAG TPA: ComEC/Rec2 family competence protein [Enhygromyxa sp.]|nr:ComEC/Rec2 family competence protein [Enhygromyxa sp.]